MNDMRRLFLAMLLAPPLAAFCAVLLSLFLEHPSMTHSLTDYLKTILFAFVGLSVISYCIAFTYGLIIIMLFEALGIGSGLAYGTAGGLPFMLFTVVIAAGERLGGDYNATLLGLIATLQGTGIALLIWRYGIREQFPYASPDIPEDTD